MLIALGVDIETTGLDYRNNHKIIEIAFTSVNVATGEIIDSLACRFNPRREIDAKASAVHRITSDMLVDCPLFEDEAAGLIERFIVPCDVIVAHNGESFDIPFLEHELKGYKMALPKRPLIDTMLEGLWACEDGKRPRLQELAFALGFTYDLKQAHGALYDTELMMKCFIRARERYSLFPLPAELEALRAA